jgi:hypothetical protein
MVLGHFFLKDTCSVLRTVSTFGLVAGVILIFQPQNFIIADFEEVGAKFDFWSAANSQRRNLRP